MFGKNKILKPEKHDGSKLDVQEIFATFQGEGIYAGYPAIFIRLGGCNLACDFCDTEFDSYKNLETEYIVETAINLAKNHKEKLAVITGGEPMRQPIEALCKKLIDSQFIVQIETNGTIFRDLDKNVKIICSPKNTGNGYGKIRRDLLARIDAIKFIISNSNMAYFNIADVGQTEFKIPVYLQPMDELNNDKNLQNIKRTIELASIEGARISLQIHKILDIK